MRKFKKFTAVLLSMVMLVCMFSVPASAKSVFDGAIKTEAMETYSKTFKSTNQAIYYKIVLNDSGTLNIRWRDSLLLDSIILYNSNAEKTCYVYNGSDIEIKKKGTYYLEIIGDKNDYITDMYYTFSPDETPTISLALNVKVGDELDFSALATNYTGKCTWKSTKPAVASVDKGKVKALKVGKAKIRAYMNNGDYAEITLVVKKK